MACPFRLDVCLTAAALLIPGILAGQLTPVTTPFSLLPENAGWPPDTVDELRTPDAVALAGGGFVVAAERNTEGQGDQSFFLNRGFGRLVASDGNLGTTFQLGYESNSPDYYVEWPLLAADGAGGFTVAWRQGRDLGVSLGVRTYGPGAVLIGGDDFHGGSGDFEGDWVTSAAGNGAGRVVLGWIDIDFETHTSGLAFQAFGPEAPEVHLDLRVPEDDWPEIHVGMDQTGRIVAVWPEEGKAVGRWFEPDGTPLGAGPFQIAGGRPVALTAWPDGTFAVAWLGPGAERSLFVRHFASDGRPLRSVFPIGRVERLPSLTDAGVSMGADRHGNLAVLWPDASRGGKPTLMLFNRSLIFQGRVELEGQGKGGVALADSGRLLAVVEDRAQLFQVRRDADACAYHGKRLLCDTGGEDGRHDEVLFFGAGWPLDVPLLGDVDGDGRDDLCLVRNSVVRCDSGHNGFPAELRFPPFRPLGGLFLLGDLDGDGRDDPCHFRDGLFRCDRARDGGQPDLVISFRGLPGDTPLLGDVNGDGKDDPCHYRNNLFLCDTAHNGGAAETRINLRGLLGTNRGTPLLGDVDGDGRDDACLVRDDRLICGSLRAGAPSPVLVADRPWIQGIVGEIPLLGNIDGI